MRHPVRRARPRIRVLIASWLSLLSMAAVAAALVAPAAHAADGPGADPSLEQHIDPNQQVVHGSHVIDTGHVDMGPKFDQGRWTFLIHDDAHRADAGASSVWRYPAETVIHVVDQAELTVPDDDAYSFIGADPGTQVWVVPQTQNPEVAWLGWNTQDPEVMAQVSRGVTLELTGVQGPGTVTVYLQSGSFGAPQVLWDSRKTEPQPVWVDVNTHTHANWVFTTPGVYLLRLRVSADLLDGTQVSDTQYLRVAVGTATSTDQALAATWTGPAEGHPSQSADAQQGAGTQVSGNGAPGQDSGAAAGQSPAGGEGSSSLVPILVALIVVVAVALVAGLIIAMMQGNRLKQAVLASYAQTAPRPPTPDPHGEEGKS